MKSASGYIPYPLLGLALLLGGTAARAATPVNPPAIYPDDLWQGRAQAQLRVLDRLDQHVETLTVASGGTATYKSLTIAAKACLERAPGVAADTAAQLDITDARPEGVAFSGWMLASHPSLNLLESPVYDVRVIACGGDKVAPNLPALVQSVANAAPASALPVDPAQGAVPAGDTSQGATGVPAGGSSPAPGALAVPPGHASAPASVAVQAGAPPAPLVLTPQDTPPARLPATIPAAPVAPGRNDAPEQLAPPMPLVPTPAPPASSQGAPVQLAPPTPYDQPSQ